jgi:hypothetical protein
MRLDLTPALKLNRKRRNTAFTLAEVVMCLVIVGMVFGGIILAYVQTERRAKWSGYSLAAQALAIQQIEQCRAAVYDPLVPKDELLSLTNLTGWTPSGTTNGSGSATVTFSLPNSTNGNTIFATNKVTITTVWDANWQSVYWHKVRVDTVWPFLWGSTSRLYTNTVISYYAPDNHSLGP